ncbi:hypothetical protein [Actinacidiphila rubida]|uniref:Lipoprotein n=1 Tax=Actinacidiphila rubida TaxID=310780 RepID=A0A1H8P6G8_9ACTN|nr:hypothetical protein [Actinacidiphila rubida]SEO37407.1 hypothetical protein SAMN05216267_1024135 [Actinacidiphila rubida]
MTRTSLPLAVALAASAGLLLSACGGGGSNSDKIQSSATTPTSAPATTASPTQAASPNAPKFDLPPDIIIDFKGFDSTDPKWKDPLRDAQYVATAILEAQSKIRTSETPNVKRYFNGLQGAKFADSVIAYGKSGNVATGTYHYYKPSVKDNGAGGTVTVTYCEDQRKAYDKNAKTGKVHVTTPSLSDFRAWNFGMAKDAAGDWQVYQYKWLQGAQQCQVA